jgi:4-hydroxy-3-methylbut-2-enyl diphosphate reductase
MSSNTQKLYKMSKSINKNTYLVEDKNDIKEIWFDEINSVGISAGASTPDYVIDEVEEKIMSFSRN